MNDRNINSIFLLTIALILTVSGASAAQIINVQPSLNVEEPNGITGEVAAEGSWKTGNSEWLRITGGLSTRYRQDRHHVYLMASGRYFSSADDSFDKQIAEHARYRFDLTEWLAPETYAQHEYNEFRRLLVRLLGGVGPRFTPYKSDIFYVAIGTSYMLEYERLNDVKDDSGIPFVDASDSELNHRWSNYISWNLVIDKRLQLSNTNYYQPRFDDFKDFRILSELSFAVQIVGTFSLKITGSVSYDSRPAISVKRFDSLLGFGLGLTFGPFFSKETPAPSQPEAG